MTLQVMNTLTHRVEPFAPRDPGHVRMYVCGPSVYDESHLGHARSFVAYDAIKRYFLAKGVRMTHVQNFTDIEEHIATRAKQHGMAPLEWATHLIGRFHEDMDRLRVLRADHYPRVSEHIEDIQRIVKRLEETKFAYRYDCGPRDFDGRGCDVYFDSDKARDYGALIGTSIEELTVERPLEMGDRRHPLDFALWKSRDDWGVTWASPWGRGRPGWHIECTAMASRYLGFDFDIHGGGLDLVFPHHENERVIGEAYSGERYCRHYLHNGFVTVGNEKMSKSLGNFVTIPQMLAKHEAEVIRAFLLGAHYRAPLNYDDESMARAERRVQAWRARIRALRERADDAQPGALPKGVARGREAFWAALEDDFHFDRALAAIDEAVDACSSCTPEQAAAILAFLREAGGTLGLLWELEGPTK